MAATPPGPSRVIIVGSGPVGMTLALELAARGVASTIVEKAATTTDHPRMDYTNARSMELLRRLGLVPALRAAAVPEEHPFDVAWVTSMAGHELYRFRYPSVADARARIREHNDGSQPLEPPMRISQVVMEPVLLDAVRAQPLVTHRFGVAFEDLAQDGNGVTAVLRDVARGATESLGADFLVGCDGGDSRVRDAAGIDLDGIRDVGQVFMVHFRSEARPLLQRFGVTWQVRSRLGTLVSQNDRDIWTLHVPLLGSTDPRTIDPSALVEAFVGAPIEHEVLVARAWTPHLLVARRYSKGRVFLAGDAAHQYVPTGAYGMNTGVGDAVDLGWKLAAFLHGHGGPGLLDAYEAERRSVGLRNRTAAATHMQVRLDIAAAYDELDGGGDDAASGAVAAFTADAKGTSAGREAVAARIRAIGNPENESRGIELGYRYDRSPIVMAEQRPALVPDPVHYRPSTAPGSRLPSTFLPDGNAVHDRLGPWFTLLAFGDGDPGPLPAVARRLGIPLAVTRVASPGPATIYERKLLLVRPDQHVAWRGDRLDDAVAAGRILERCTGRGET